MAADSDGPLVLVTGGAGFIGSHLVDALLERGSRVRVLDNLSTGLRDNLPQDRERLEIVRGDIREIDDCARAVTGCKQVFHQAALGSVPRSIEDPATSIDVNVGGTANVFTAARDAGVPRVVYASSSSVYGDSVELPKREGNEGRLLSPYAASKAMNEQLAQVFADRFSMELVGLRYFNVYGPRQRPDGPYAAVIPRFFHAALSGARPGIFGDGEQSRDFTFVEDAVRANLLAAEAPLAERAVAVNVAGGERTTVNDLAQLVLGLCGAQHEPEHLPPRPGDVAHSLADLELAERLLGYSPRTDLASGLEKSLPHYAESAGR